MYLVAVDKQGYRGPLFQTTAAADNLFRIYTGDGQWGTYLWIDGLEEDRLEEVSEDEARAMMAEIDIYNKGWA